MTHHLNAYPRYADNHVTGKYTWIIYCERCGLETDQLLGSQCAGKIEPIVKEGVDKLTIDRYVNRLMNV